MRDLTRPVSQITEASSRTPGAVLILALLSIVRDEQKINGQLAAGQGGSSGHGKGEL
jgi:hypothetical protein